MEIRMLQIDTAVFIGILALAVFFMFLGVLFAVLVSLQLRKVLEVMQRYQNPRFRLACALTVFLVNTIMVYLISFELSIGSFIRYLDADVASIFHGSYFSRIVISLILSFILVPAILGDLVLGGRREDTLESEDLDVL